jgi:hypothetical protein
VKLGLALCVERIIAQRPGAKCEEHDRNADEHHCERSKRFRRVLSARGGLEARQAKHGQRQRAGGDTQFGCGQQQAKEQTRTARTGREFVFIDDVRHQ